MFGVTVTALFTFRTNRAQYHGNYLQLAGSGVKRYKPWVLSWKYIKFVENNAIHVTRMDLNITPTLSSYLLGVIGKDKRNDLNKLNKEK